MSSWINRGHPTGSTMNECGACRVCAQGVAQATQCCPGMMVVPSDYDESLPVKKQAQFFKYASDSSCAECIVGCDPEDGGAWPSSLGGDGQVRRAPFCRMDPATLVGLYRGLTRLTALPPVQFHAQVLRGPSARAPELEALSRTTRR